MAEVESRTSAQIPTQFHGTWHGEVIDANRVDSYFGEIVIEAGSVNTRYDMKRGEKRGAITIEGISEQGVTLSETVGSWRGTLQLSLDSKRDLKCVWRVRNKQTAVCKMNRV